MTTPSATAKLPTTARQAATIRPQPQGYSKAAQRAQAGGDDTLGALAVARHQVQEEREEPGAVLALLPAGSAFQALLAQAIPRGDGDQPLPPQCCRQTTIGACRVLIGSDALRAGSGSSDGDLVAEAGEVRPRHAGEGGTIPGDIAQLCGRGEDAPPQHGCRIEAGLTEISAAQVRSPQACAAQVHHGEGSTAQVCLAQVGAAQVRANLATERIEVRPKPGTAQIRSEEVGAAQVRVAQVGAA